MCARLSPNPMSLTPSHAPNLCHLLTLLMSPRSLTNLNLPFISIIKIVRISKIVGKGRSFKEHGCSNNGSGEKSAKKNPKAPPKQKIIIYFISNVLRPHTCGVFPKRQYEWWTYHKITSLNLPFRTLFHLCFDMMYFLQGHLGYVAKFEFGIFKHFVGRIISGVS